MSTERKYATEAALCADFIAWAHGETKGDPYAPNPKGVRCYAEWAGWDVLLVYPDGLQVGIQAKLRLNAEVILQAAPDAFGYERESGPDHRAVLVPAENPMAEVARRLGLIVFRPSYRGFEPSLAERPKSAYWRHDGGWFDWNPPGRHELPPVATDAIAGSPCPVSLTPWKLGALDVLAELELAGTITTKRMREIGVSPKRWLEYGWLVPAENRGDWKRGDRCPRFEEQHPTAWEAARQKALARPKGETA